MSEEAKNAMQISNPSSQPFMLMNGLGGVGTTLTSGGIPLPMARTPVAHSQQRMLEMMGPKEILQYEIEQEKDKIAGKERK